MRNEIKDKEMSKDIVDILLNEWEAAKMDTPHGLPAFKDAADEIMRLRELVQKISEVVFESREY